VPRQRIVAPRRIDNEEIRTLGKRDQFLTHRLHRRIAEDVETRCGESDIAP
jgi:hypothetical protein